MTVLGLRMDAMMRWTLNELREHFKESDDAAILRRAVALLCLFKKADDRGEKIVVLDHEGTVVREIVP